VIAKGLSKKIEGPVAPTQPNFDPTVKEPAYNPEAAKKLLAEDGWADHDGDGILDKIIDGKKVDFKFTFTAPSGSDVPKQVLLIVSNGLKKAGIAADITQIEWSVYLQNQRNHNFDASLGAWIGNMDEDEISQLWESSQSKNKGSNAVSYSDPEADKLMEAIKIEPDKAKRFEMSHQLQHLMVDDQPVTWMYSSPARIAWIDRFDNFEFFRSRPPFSVQYWIVRGSGVQRRPTGIPMSLSPNKISPTP
jgi:ABC-type transport system substrate-binding protein